MRRASALMTWLASLAVASSVGASWRVVEVAAPVHRRQGEAAVALPDGRILLIGGSEESVTVPCRSTEIFDPATRQFTEGPRLIVPRYQPAALALDDGRVLVAGGSTTSYIVMTATAEVIDLRAGRSALTGAMSIRRGGTPFLARASRDNVVILGGITEGRCAEATRIVERWNARTGEWSIDGALQLPCQSEAIIHDGNSVIRVHGNHRSCEDSVQEGCRAWIEVWDLKARRSVLLANPGRAAPSVPTLIRTQAGEVLALAPDRSFWLRRQPAGGTSGADSWSLTPTPRLTAFPPSQPTMPAASLGDDDIAAASIEGVLILHPLTGRSPECLAPDRARNGRMIAIRPGMALLLGGAESWDEGPVLIATDEALQGSSLPLPPTSAPKP